jgi:hypothetical protein
MYTAANQVMLGMRCVSLRWLCCSVWHLQNSSHGPAWGKGEAGCSFGTVKNCRVAVLSLMLHAACCLNFQVHASLIVVLTRGGSTGRLVAKYRPLVPVLTVAVPVLTTDSLTWTCSNEAPARQVCVGLCAAALVKACGCAYDETSIVSSSRSCAQLHMHAWASAVRA